MPFFLLDPEETGSPEEYLAQFAGMGEFGHSMDKPILSFLAGMLQVTIIVPLIEAVTGEEVFTGEDLSDYERGMRVVFAVVDAVSLGNSLAATGIAGMGCREALAMTGKVVAVEFVSDTAAYMAGEAGTGLGLPMPVVLLLSLGTGITVSRKGTDLLFKNTGGDILATAHNAAKNVTDGTLDILNGNAYDDILTAGRRADDAADAAGTSGRRAGRVTDGVDGRDVRHGDIHVQQTECTEAYGDYLLRECGSGGGTVTLKHKATSGIEITSTPGKTTTVLGRYGSDTGDIIAELNIPKNTDFSGNPGGFNLLNTPDEYYITAEQFWNDYNKPFLDAAIERGDEILMATPINSSTLYTKSGDLTGYGREYYYLLSKGYEYTEGRMIL